jgi:hypothetical protein
VPGRSRLRREGDRRLARTLLRQLAALTRPIPAAGPRALALAVYSDASGEQFEARESGVEGVACVDDAARASTLLYRLWAATGNDNLKHWAEGLLDFVLWMQAGGGLWHNFIFDWHGARNLDGLTSAAGVNFWQARATCALAEANLVLQQDRARDTLTQAFEIAESAAPPSDVRAIHALSLLAVLRRAPPDLRLTRLLGTWCDELAACQRDGMLMNSPDERGRPHLWGHVQEAALADASIVLDRPDLLTLAITSADAVFADVIDSGFDIPHVHSYDVQSATFVMDRLAAVTGQTRYAEMARAARSWFDGRNPGGAAIYDRATGRVADGLDDRRMSDRSGAEANVTAGLALAGDVGLISMARGWTQVWQLRRSPYSGPAGSRRRSPQAPISRTGPR